MNKKCYANTLIDTGCLSYGIVDSRFVRKHNLPRLSITPRMIEGFDDISKDQITEVAECNIDIDGHCEERIFLYVAPRLASYDMILGLPWARKQRAVLDAEKSECLLRSTQVTVKNQAHILESSYDHVHVSAVAFTALSRRAKKKKQDENLQIFAASMKDIEKALRPKTTTDPRTKLPIQYHEFLDVFDKKEADKLPPIRGNSVDHKIELIQQDGKKAEAPWGPLYNMSRDELLVLRKTLTEYLDKGFIRVSNSPAAAPVLFVRKPGGGLRFCVDYRGLNKITRKDRYPLPLIQETLRNAGKAKWYTKLDVVAAFHKIRIAEGDEWMTAFRTRYGLYEWMVTPFGLANAPSTFQRYINWALRDFLDDFCSAYVDDILIYTDGSLKQHRRHVRQVLERLRAAGLQVDIDKCEFETKSTKYLGFILEAGKGIRMDPEKIQAIEEWQAPKTATAVRSFLGFANFYRTFIPKYSDIAMPLVRLTHKNAAFSWNNECQQAFNKLKKMFTNEQILVRFDPDKETILETDSSGYCTGGMLMQVQDDGMLRPCAFFSKKNSPAECNYEIYDKEMLAIIRCLEAWDAELRSVEGFEVRTDHKNLEYFMTARKLTERQMRWSLILSRYNFTISYIPGKMNERADALSRREQDMPHGQDDRTDYRTMQLLRPGMFKNKNTLSVAPVRTQTERTVRSPSESTEDLQALWNEAMTHDETYEAARDAIRKEKATFPRELNLKVSLSECSLDSQERLLFRGRKWVPDFNALRTKMTQRTHDDKICGHPGRDNTSQVLSRNYFWPRMSEDVRRFVRNCHVCRRSKSWKDQRQGFLKPLPIPDQVWKEISIDFIVDLPESDGCTNIVVVTDRLSRGVILEGLPDIRTETVANWFLKTFYRRHFLPRAIVSDRGVQFVNRFWKRLCQQLGIVRRLSTAYHPETDGATERMNQTLEVYLRIFTSYAQDDWNSLLPGAELAMNNTDSVTTKVSPFFLEHGYSADPLDLEDIYEDNTARDSPIAKAERVVRKLRDAREWAQSAMAATQQIVEKAVNEHRQEGPKYKVNDKVWLDLRNVRTDRPSKKLDDKYAKYTVTEVVGSHSYRLNTPPGIHNVFHSMLLRPASYDPLEGQEQDDTHPDPVIQPNEENEWEIDRIEKEKGTGRRRKLLVRWKGYARPTWEPASALEETAALDAWEARTTTRGGG